MRSFCCQLPLNYQSLFVLLPESQFYKVMETQFSVEFEYGKLCFFGLFVVKVAE